MRKVVFHADGPANWTIPNRLLVAQNVEPPHVHVRRDRCMAKYWLEPLVELANNVGFAPRELTVIRQMIDEHRERLLEAWHDHFHGN